MIQQDMISHVILMLTFGQSCFAKKNCNKVVLNFKKKEHQDVANYADMLLVFF